MATGAYPGSFNPPTVAHLAIAEAAWRRFGLERLDLVVSRSALGKRDLGPPRLADRLEVLRSIVSGRPWLGVVLTDSQLLVDLSAGYDVVVLGADKWAQVSDPSWYGGSLAARDEALGRLPRVVVVPRPPHPTPELEVLAAPPWHAAVSSSAVRGGRRDWMVPEAAEFDLLSGAWSDPGRYRQWVRSMSPHRADPPSGRLAPVALLDDEAIAAGLGGLSWVREGDQIVRTYQAGDFAGALRFVNAVGQLAEAANHHPDIDIRWNKVTLRLSTHSEGGITAADLDLAAKIDALG